MYISIAGKRYEIAVNRLTDKKETSDTLESVSENKYKNKENPLL